MTLGVCLALSVGYIGATGGMFTLVSPMVPMTILVTATATLVYLHSRFVERPPDRPEAEHQIFALANKFLACTASIFATGVGFAALMISAIRPIREMGHWVAVGLAHHVGRRLHAVPGAAAHPAHADARRSASTTGGRIERFAEWLPAWSYHLRWPLVVAALALSAAGARGAVRSARRHRSDARAHRIRSSTSTATRRCTAT